ncbi:hypothetical protein Tco_1387540, partial [Tanacetum coccineum]
LKLLIASDGSTPLSVLPIVGLIAVSHAVTPSLALYSQADYNMLEDVKRIADSVERRRLQICGKYHAELPDNLRKLLNAARHRSIRIFFLPTGMSKRKTNRTFFNYRIVSTVKLHRERNRVGPAKKTQK